MSKRDRGSPLGFAMVGNTTVASFFAFITGATTVSGLFWALFGLAGFSYILVGDVNVNMYTIIRALGVLPNPLEFIRDCNQIVSAISRSLNGLKWVANGTGNALLDMVLSIAVTITKLAGYVFSALTFAILLPFYLVYFFIRCIVCVLLALGFNWPGLSLLTKPWQPLSYIIGILG